MKKIILLLSLFFLSFSAIAYEGPITFVPYQVFVSTEDDFYFRVIDVAEGTWHCAGATSGPPWWSYVDFNDPTAKTKIATIMMAYQTGQAVNLMTQGVDVDSDGDGATEHYCQIMQVWLSR